MIVLLVGAILMIRGGIFGMFAAVLAWSLLGGSSALDLPALGGSSIQPAYLALGFLILRIILADAPTRLLIAKSFPSNAALVVFCVYGVIGAMILPRIFEGVMEVASLKVKTPYLFYADPLRYTSQNLTSAIYLVGTLLAALAAWIVARGTNVPARVPMLLITLTFAHVGQGLIALALTTAGRMDVLEIIRNANYAQLDQSYRGLLRIAGFFPEASAYAAYGLPLLVVTTEMWLRNIQSRLSGIAALTLAAMLVFSTSSSAYVGLAGYGLLLVLRILIFPGAIPPRKVLNLLSLGFVGTIAVLGAALAFPRFAATFVDMLSAMTVAKGESSSGLQRQFWARQGIEAFKASFGLGIGTGSFRSSSLITAIAGSMGVIGLIAFTAYVWDVLKPLRASTYYGGRDVPFSHALGAAVGWAAVVGLIPATVSLPTPDPGLMFALFAGLAIGLRSNVEPVLLQMPMADPQSSRSNLNLEDSQPVERTL